MSVLHDATVVISAPYGGDRTPELMGKEYDDLVTYGDNLNYDHPIKKIALRHGGLVDAIGITYNFLDGSEETVWHGATRGGQPTYEITLGETEDVVEMIGAAGASVHPAEGSQVHLLTFKILNTKNGHIRYTETQGNGNLLVDETCQDILIRGKLVGLAGQANNDLTRTGMNKVQFYTKVDNETR